MNLLHSLRHGGLVIGLVLCQSWLGHAADDTLPRGTDRLDFSYHSGKAENWFSAERGKDPLQLDGLAADYRLDWTELSYTYGWADDLSVILKAAHGKATLESSASGFETSGIGGYYIGFRQRLNRRGTGTRLISEIGARFNEESDIPLPLSSGGIDYIAVMSYNQDFLPTRGGFELDFGYRYRTGGPADEIFLDTSLKLTLLKVVLTRFYYKTTESDDDKRIDYSFLQYPEERGFQLAGLQFSRKLAQRWELMIGYEDVFRGRNVFDTSGFKLGVTWWP